MRKVCAAILSAAICLAVSGAPAWASEQQATLSAGYLHARTNAPGSDNLNGINVKYRYEFTDTLGLVTSFSYAGDKNRQLTRYSDTRWHEDSVRNRWFSVMAGPSVRVNEWFSAYAMAGTNEFIGEGDAYIPPHTGLPANSTDIAPPDIPAGFVAVFNSDEASWHLVEDHRGKTVYDVASGDALFISELGLLPENVTWLSPEGEFQKWNGTTWVKDAEAEKLFRIREAEETKNSLMQVASEHIAPLQDAVDLEIATEEETSLLEAWKKYRVLLNRVDTSTAPDIEWPTNPVRE
ncbi:TPA: Ail/Lom family outer membrane beta-barrel protein [Escherichia coli]|nr:Ail/Lom family outer membrane beta-barrel protein [Escherichia coli]